MIEYRFYCAGCDVWYLRDDRPCGHQRSPIAVALEVYGLTTTDSDAAAEAFTAT